MSMDKRIETKVKPMYGCHSELDKYKKAVPPCEVEHRFEEKACDGCVRQEEKEIKNGMD